MGYRLNNHIVIAKCKFTLLCVDSICLFLQLNIVHQRNTKYSPQIWQKGKIPNTKQVSSTALLLTKLVAAQSFRLKKKLSSIKLIKYWERTWHSPLLLLYHHHLNKNINPLWGKMRMINFNNTILSSYRAIFFSLEPLYMHMTYCKVSQSKLRL